MVKDPVDVLDRQKCLDALAVLRHAKWFQVRNIILLSSCSLMRCIISVYSFVWFFWVIIKLFIAKKHTHTHTYIQGCHLCQQKSGQSMLYVEMITQVHLNLSQKKPPSKELASLYPQSNLDWHIVTCDSIRLHSNQHKVVPSRSAFMFNVCIVLFYIFCTMRIERKRNISIFCFDFATRQNTGKVKQISLPLSVLIFSSQVDSCTLSPCLWDTWTNLGSGFRRWQEKSSFLVHLANCDFPY